MKINIKDKDIRFNQISYPVAFLLAKHAWKEGQYLLAIKIYIKGILFSTAP